MTLFICILLWLSVGCVTAGPLYMVGDSAVMNRRWDAIGYPLGEGIDPLEAVGFVIVLWPVALARLWKHGRRSQ